MLASALLVSLLLAQTPIAGDSLVVTLLGTGTPQPRSDRLGPATLIEAGGLRLLFDAGRGVPIRLEESGIRTGSVQVVFLTHHHSDHTTGLPDLWLTGWLRPFGGRTTALRVIGPIGTRGLVEGLRAAFAEDIRIRSSEENLPLAGIQLRAEEFASDTVVFNEQGVMVESFLVDHGGEFKPAYGYRISYAGHSVVISGDTRYSPNLVAHAQHVDVLIHEVAMAPAAIQDQPQIRFIVSHHTSPAEVARVFALTSPRLAVLTHFALPPSRQAGGDLTPEMVLAATRALYHGRLEGGRDLMRITVSDSIRVTSAGGVR